MSEGNEIPKAEPTTPTTPTTDPVPAPPPFGGAFWQSQTGRLVLWAVNVLVISLVFIAVSWLAVKSGIPVPMPVPPTPVVVQEAPPPQAAVESPTQFYCGRVETIRDQILTKPWPVKVITWHVNPENYRGNISPVQIKEAFTVAYAAWGAHIDTAFEYTPDADKALISSKWGDIDGSGRVLAWSELADGTKTPKHQLYDTGEKWELASNPKQIDLVRVAVHEIGHALGLVHDDEDEPAAAIMKPAYDRNIRFPTARDVKRLVAMGYAPKPGPKGGPTIPPLNLTIDAKQIIDALERAGYVVQKK